jgi:hypothetical protein
LPPVKIDVFDTQPAALHEPQAAAVHQSCHETVKAMRAFDRGQQPSDFISRQYDGESFGALGALR